MPRTSRTTDNLQRPDLLTPPRDPGAARSRRGRLPRAGAAAKAGEPLAKAGEPMAAKAADQMATGPQPAYTPGGSVPDTRALEARLPGVPAMEASPPDVAMPRCVDWITPRAPEDPSQEGELVMGVLVIVMLVVSLPYLIGM